MLDKVIENNRVTIIGEVVSDFTYSHEVFGEGFYMVDIAVNRLSNSVVSGLDIVIVTACVSP